MKRRKFLPIILAIFIMVFILKPVTAITASTEPTLPDSIEEEKIVNFTVTITDISGNCVVIETDLEKANGRPIFNIDGLTQYNPQFENNGKYLRLCGDFPNKLAIPVYGKVPEGVNIQEVNLPTGESLYLKFFDTGQKNYYRVKDMKNGIIVDSTSKSFTIIHPYLMEATEIIKNNITDKRAREVALRYIDLGLVDYVYHDLIPLFTKYDPERVAKLELQINELENTVKKLNTTVVSQKDEITRLQEKVARLEGENSNLKTKASKLEEENKKLKEQIDTLSKEKESYAGSAKTYQMIAIVLVVLLIGASFFLYRAGRKSGYKEGYRKGYDEGKQMGYNKGVRDGYEKCMEEMNRNEPPIG